MKKLIMTAAALMVAVTAYGQGSFLFNTRDIAGGNNVTFRMPNGDLATGADLFVEVLAGTSAATLVPLTPTLPLNRTGAGAGYTSPFSQIYEVPGVAAGTAATVGYRAYQGTSWDSSLNRSDVTLATAPVTLTAPPTPPNSVALGTTAVSLQVVPEPTTLALGLLGLGSLLLFRRRQ